MSSKKSKEIASVSNSYPVSYQWYDNSGAWYEALLEDIKKATNSIYIESFRIANDIIGKQLCDALIEKVKEKVQVKVLVDWWGTSTYNPYLKELLSAGGEVRFFQKFVLSVALFSRNHMRDHRKIVVIDKKISYIGSANFSHYSTKWRESILRIDNPSLAKILRKIFLENYKIYKKDMFSPYIKKAFKKTIRYDHFLFVREIPSMVTQRIKKIYVRMIRSAKHSIVIETPYFLPGYRIHTELIAAAKRGVNVTIIVPQNSDVKIVDYVRDVLWGKLHKKGIDIYFYTKSNLHSKLILIDNLFFSVGSANLDHRSFKYMFEIAMLGYNKEIVELISKHNAQTLVDTLPFDLKKWKTRPLFKRIIALFVAPFRHLL